MVNGTDSACIVATQQAVAEAFGVTVHAVAKWAQRGMPGSPGNYDVRAVEEWRRATMKTLQNSDLVAESELDRARLIRAMADRTEALAAQAWFEVDNRIRVIDLDEVASFIEEFLAELERLYQPIMSNSVARKYGDRANFYKHDVSARLEMLMKQLQTWRSKLDDLKIKEFWQ